MCAALATMASIDHPNVLPLLAYFEDEQSQKLWLVHPFMAAGSLRSIIRYRHPEVSASQFWCMAIRSRQLVLPVLHKLSRARRRRSIQYQFMLEHASSVPHVVGSIASVVSALHACPSGRDALMQMYCNVGLLAGDNCSFAEHASAPP